MNEPEGDYVRKIKQERLTPAQLVDRCYREAGVDLSHEFIRVPPPPQRPRWLVAIRRVLGYWWP